MGADTPKGVVFRADVSLAVGMVFWAERRRESGAVGADTPKAVVFRADVSLAVGMVFWAERRRESGAAGAGTTEEPSRPRLFPLAETLA